MNLKKLSNNMVEKGIAVYFITVMMIGVGYAIKANFEVDMSLWMRLMSFIGISIGAAFSIRYGVKYNIFGFRCLKKAISNLLYSKKTLDV